jgi:hypothetical protein
MRPKRDPSERLAPVPFSLRLSEADAERLRKEAEARGLPASSLLRMLLRESLAGRPVDLTAGGGHE